MTTPTPIETVRLDPETVLVASPERAWIRRGPPTTGAAATSDGAGGVALARVLLDGAVAAAFRFARPAAVPAMTVTRWAYRLAGLYHLTHSTPALLGRAAERFEAAGRAALAGWARARAREESHHDLLALRDLRDLGHDADAVVAAIRPPITLRLVDYFAGTVAAADPIGCVGYAYALERLAMTVGEAEIRAIEAILPPGTRATRCLRVHSAAGSDADHVADTLVVVAELSAAERAAIAVAAFEAARLCFTPDPAGAPSDRAIAARLAAAAPAPVTMNSSI